MEQLTNITIDNSLEEFKMLDKMYQKCELSNDMEGIRDCHYIMAQIVKKLEPVHNELFEKHPEYKEIFTVFMRNYHD